MSVHRPNLIGRLVPVTAAMAILLAACGSEDPSADPVDSVDTTDEEGGLRAPTPIEAAGTGSSSSGGDARVAAEAATDMMIAPAYVVTDFLVSPDLPALPENTTGYVYDAATTPTADQVAELAAVFGVEGEPVEVDDGYSVSWRVGPNDGTAPSVSLWDDAMLSWNYDMAWQNQTGFGCASAGSAGVDPAVAPVEPAATEPGELDKPEETVAPDVPAQTLTTEPIMECETPEPPAGVPTSGEAEALATDYLTQLGVDPATVVMDTYSDEWSASVNANLMLDDVVAQSWGFTFGADAALQYAWGNAATPEAVGPYTLVDLDTAVARLKADGYGWPTARGDIALMSDVVTDSGSGTSSGDATVSSEPAIEPAVEPAVDPAIGVAEAEVDAPPPDPESIPIDAMPVEPPIEPEEITVTLVDVQSDLWWIWDVHGSAWLVPAYRFTGDDGGVYTVPAVTDDFLVQTDQPVTTEPAVPETTLPSTGGPLDQYLGLALADFEAAVEAAGLGPVRVVEIDGEPQAVTMDLREGRVNVAVSTRDGVQYVTSATVESIDGDVTTTEPHVTEPPTTTPPTTVAAELVPIVGTFEDVVFYPACGNEILEHEGVVWYTVAHVGSEPMDDGLRQALADLSAVDREPSPVSGPNGFAARVAAPGPGDDVGTLVVWGDGVARWVSESGNLDVWLLDTELTYNWVC